MKRLLLPLLALWTLAACAHQAPHSVSGQAMVSAANPLAADAGAAVLRQGGSATDATIAAMAVLGLVEPQSAGVGGGGFLLAYDSATGAVSAFDGREAAPAAATPDYFVDASGKPLPFPQAVASGLSTGAQSLFAMLKLAHDKNGKLPWASLFDPAIKLAEDGFIVSPRMAGSIASAQRFAIKDDPAARAYLFTPDGQPLTAGTLLKNPAYAATLRAIAKDGPVALQKGPIADAILAAIRQEPRPGKMTAADLADVKPRETPAVCGPYRIYVGCGAPPPSSGGVAIVDLLGLYERARPHPVGAGNADDWAAFVWASRIAYADRDYYLADDTVVPVPVKELIDPKFIDARAALIDLSKAAPAKIAPGDTAIVSGPSYKDKWGDPNAEPENGTTHLSVVDSEGDAVALTASVESVFGSRRMAAGFFLNNQLTDFAREPRVNGKLVANAPAAGKKPRSSMSPTMVFTRDHKLYAVIGSPGGSSIIAYVAKTLVGLIDWKLSMQDAINLPNVVANGETVRLESGRMAPAIPDALAARGWKVAPGAGENSGLHGIVLRPGGLEGGADPRREGKAVLVTP